VRFRAVQARRNIGPAGEQQPVEPRRQIFQGRRRQAERDP